MDEFIKAKKIKKEKITLFQSSSEEIIRQIINKIISYVITIHHCNTIEEKIPKKCYNYLKNQIHTYASYLFIPYDKDEGNIKINEYNSQTINTQNLFFDTERSGINNWNDIPMPEHVTIDRDCSSFINIDEEIRSDLNEVDALSKNKQITKIQRTLRHLGTYRDSYRDTFRDLKKKKNNRVELPYYDLPEDETEVQKKKLEKKYDELRNEMKEKKIMEELEKKKQMELELEMMEKKRKAQEKKIEEMLMLKNKKITVDAKGSIVIIKGINIDKLIPEFTSAPSKAKELKVIQNPINEVKGPNSEIEQNDDLRITKKIINDNKKVKNISYRLSRNILHKSIIHKEKENSFSPSGSNFELINPEVGVVIRENNNVKSGGKDFHRKYEKYSFNAFDKYNKSESNSFIKERNYYQSGSIPKQKIKNKISDNINESIQENINENIEIDMEDKDKEKNKNFDMKVIEGNIPVKKLLDDLDLVNEDSINQKGNFTNISFFNKKPIVVKNSNIPINDDMKYLDMNKFNCTIMSKANWGGEKNISKYTRNNGFPIELKRNYSENVKKHRERNKGRNQILPKLNDTKHLFRTSSGFYVKKKGGQEGTK